VVLRTAPAKPNESGSAHEVAVLWSLDESWLSRPKDKGFSHFEQERYQRDVESTPDS
jgi:hypothetical protein